MIKKNILLLAMILLTMLEISAQKFFTKTGTLDFEASVEAFEPVKASHSSTTAVLDASTGKIAVLALVKGFRFKNALMEEHFNENYMESDELPKTKFEGSLGNFSVNDLKSGEEKEFKIDGNLTIHGITKAIETLAVLKMNGKDISLTTNFSVLPADYGIDIPSVVKDKIAGKINITSNFNLIKR